MLNGSIKYLSKSDPEAKKMKSRDGYIAGYNVQSVIDKKHHLIALLSAKSNQIDNKLLNEMLEEIKHELGRYPERLTTDKGYYETLEVQKAEGIKTDLYVPMPL